MLHTCRGNITVYDQNINLYREHYEELLREAEEVRTAQEALGERPAGDRGFNPALAWMGKRMVTLGQSLMKLSGDEDGSEPNINLN